MNNFKMYAMHTTFHEMDYGYRIFFSTSYVRINNYESLHFNLFFLSIKFDE